VYNLQQQCELFTCTTVVWVNESMSSSLLINCSHHKKNIPYNKKKKNIKSFVLTQKFTMHTIKWDHCECLTVYAPYCCCTYTCFLQIVLNWQTQKTVYYVYIVCYFIYTIGMILYKVSSCKAWRIHSIWKKESKNKMCSFCGSKFEDIGKLTTYIHTCMPKYMVLTFRDGLT